MKTAFYGARIKGTLAGFAAVCASAVAILVQSAGESAHRMKLSFIQFKAELMELAAGLLSGLCRRESLARLSADMLSLLLCGAAMAMFCSAVEGGLDLFMSIFVPLIFVCAVFFAFTESLGGSRLYCFCTVLLIVVGVALQVLLLLPVQAGESVGANKLMLFALTGLLFSALVLPALIYLLRCAPPRAALRLVLLVTALVYAVLFTLGSRINGTRAWILIGGFSLQLTEVTKFLGITSFALILADGDRSAQNRLRAALGVLGFHAACLFLANELGTLIVLVFCFFALAFMYLPSVKPLVIVAAGLAAACVLMLLFCRGCHAAVSEATDHESVGKLVETAAMIYEKVSLRVDVILRPETVDANAGGYQAARAREAIILSEWLGTTFDVHVPVIESDYIFIYVVLKMGVLFAALVLLILLLMLVRAVCCCLGADRGCESALGAGFALCIVLQSLLAAMSAAGFIPTVGIPFAFLSQGGTQTVFNYAMSFFVIYAGRQLLPAPADTPERREPLCRKTL